MILQEVPGGRERGRMTHCSRPQVHRGPWWCHTGSWVGGGALKENVLLYVMTVGWLDQSKALSTQRGPCVRTCVCVCMREGVWRLRLYTADTCSSGTKERGQCEDSVLFTISISDFLMFLIPHRMGSNTIISTKSQRGQEKLIIPSHVFMTSQHDITIIPYKIINKI